MTWFVKDDGYELFFNRDERISRRRAEPPSLQQLHNIDYIAPTDADAGGTWIAANQFGVTVCLLNHYQFEQIETYKNWVSRGEIVRQFSSTNLLAEAQKQFLTINLDDFRAFRLFIIELSGENCLFIWDGHQTRIERNVDTPKSSSAVDAKHVKALRKDLFRDLDLADSKDAASYIAFHASHLPGKPGESVCMHRDQGNTVSLSHVKVSTEELAFAYADGSPCQTRLGEPITLKLLQD